MSINLSFYTITEYKKIKKLFEDLSDSITSMKYESPYIPFALLDDSLISKIQNQIVTLFNDIKIAKENGIKEKEYLSSLISDISHQIKTPLTQLNLYNELLSQEKETGKSLKHEFDETLKHLTWLIEAIFNLLDNAVKYSPGNSTIVISNEKRELFYTIIIKDQGSGIDNDELNNIYKRFYRGKNVKNLEGVGIGLALSQKIMNMQGGYIHCKSTIDKGSEFSVYLSIIN